jgi:glycerophosphoryl diester phosphodiesterase
MLVIGHRGAKGLAPENTLDSLQAGFESDADILEFDVRFTKDGELVVVHDARLKRTHHQPLAVSGLTLKELRELTADDPIPTLREVLDSYFGKIILNIEIKSRGAGPEVIKLLKRRYINKASDWDNILLSSYKGSELVKIRKLSKRANLALYHLDNPFIFIAYHRRLKLTAVGFHRLYINQFALEIAKRLELFTYVFTVNRTGAIALLQKQGIDGIVTDYPDKFKQYILANPEESDTRL